MLAWALLNLLCGTIFDGNRLGIYLRKEFNTQWMGAVCTVIFYIEGGYRGGFKVGGQARGVGPFFNSDIIFVFVIISA